jgi:type II secretory pathway pseudopilin PulG
MVSIILVIMKEENRTIVGGRPGADRAAGDFPRGVEILLKKAKADPQFRELLLQEPIAAAQSLSLWLSEGETRMLRSIPKSLMETMVAHTVVPRQHIKIFQNAKTAGVLALLLASTVVMPSFAAAGVETPQAAPAEQTLAKERMQEVQKALEAYRKEHGRYPSTSEGLEMPNPLSDYLPAAAQIYDPWQRKLHYLAFKEQGKIVNYLLESLGPKEASYYDNITCPLDTEAHRFPEMSPVRVIYPEPGCTIQAFGKSLLLKAEHANRRVIVKWYLDDVEVGSTTGTHELSVKAQPGFHQLLLKDENEYSALVHFQLLEWPAGDD